MSADVIVTALMATTAGASFMWYRAVQARKQLEARLWGYAEAKGMPIGNFLSQMPTGVVPLPQRESSRMEQLEHQVDQLAQQMERISESQDFISRVLTDRIEQLPDPRMRTPH